MDVYDYFDQRERECRGLSLAPDGDWSDLFAEEAGTGGMRGTMFGRFPLSERAFLSVRESVVIDEDGVTHREEYSYYLIIDGEEIGGYDRDPDHDPPDHMHCGPDHARQPHAVTVSFQQAVEHAWDIVSRHEDAFPDEETLADEEPV